MIRIFGLQSNNMKLKKYSIGPNEKNVFEYLEKNEIITVKVLSDLVNISDQKSFQYACKNGQGKSTDNSYKRKR